MNHGYGIGPRVGARSLAPPFEPEHEAAQNRARVHFRFWQNRATAKAQDFALYGVA